MKKISFFIAGLLLLNAAAAIGQTFSINNTTGFNLAVTVYAHDVSHSCGTLTQSFGFPGTINTPTMIYSSVTDGNDMSCATAGTHSWVGGACAVASGSGWDGVDVKIGCGSFPIPMGSHSICGGGSHMDTHDCGVPTTIYIKWIDDGFGDIQVDVHY